MWARGRAGVAVNRIKRFGSIDAEVQSPKQVASLVLGTPDRSEEPGVGIPAKLNALSEGKPNGIPG